MATKDQNQTTQEQAAMNLSDTANNATDASVSPGFFKSIGNAFTAIGRNVKAIAWDNKIGKTATIATAIIGVGYGAKVAVDSVQNRFDDHLNDDLGRMGAALSNALLDD